MKRPRIFVLMLLNVKVEARKGPAVSLSLLAGITAVCFLTFLIPLFQRAFYVFDENVEVPAGTVAAIGRLLYVEYIFPFEAASVLIMASIVGAVMLAKRSTGRSE